MTDIPYYYRIPQSVFIDASPGAQIVTSNPSIDNLMSLEEWREEISYNPYHFWQLANDIVPVTSSCNNIVREHAWQVAQTAGRDEIRRSIVTAENKILPYLGYSPLPHWKSVVVDFPHYMNKKLERLSYLGEDSRWIPVQLPEGYTRALGVQTVSLIEEVEVTYWDTTGDGLYDTFTCSCPTGLSNPDELALYFVVGDRWGNTAMSDRWMIKPVDVSISNGTAYFSGRSWLMVRPVLYEGFIAGDSSLDPNELNIGGKPVHCAQTVQICRRYTFAGNDYDTAQVILVWESLPYPSWATVNPNSNDPSSLGYALARGVISDALHGIIGIGEAYVNTTSGEWTSSWFDNQVRPPDRMIVNYEAGYSEVNGQHRMDSRLRPVVARLSTAELNKRICACDTANAELHRWQFDLARSSGMGDEAYGAIGQDALNNPLGTRRGQIEAWKYVKGLRTLKGFVP